MDPIDAERDLHAVEETLLSVCDRLDLFGERERKVMIAVRLIREVRHGIGMESVRGELAAA